MGKVEVHTTNFQRWWVMSSWRECKLGEVISSISDTYKFTDEKVVFLNTSDVYLGKIINKNEFNPKDLPGQAKKRIKKNDLLFSEIRPANGRYALVVDDVENYVVSTKLMVLRSSENILPNFLNIFLTSKDMLEYLQMLAEDRSGTFPQITFDNISNIDISLPPIEEQKAIAEVLSSLDDKIDLLHRQNQTLESLAQTLFRQWFIEEAKEEREEQSLIDAVVLVGGGTPKTSVQEYWDGEIGWLAGGDISSHHKGFISKTEKTITQAGLKNSSTKLLPKYTTVISARGTVGKYCLLAKSMAFSQSNYGVMPKFEDCYFFTYLLISHSVEELQAAAYGSVFDTITTKTFQEHNITLPDEKTVKEFEKEMKPYFTKIESNTKQIQTLEKMRDVLLPKLLSGEVRIGG